MSARKKPVAVADPPAEVAPAVPAAPVATPAAKPSRRAPVASATPVAAPAAPKPARQRTPKPPVAEPAVAPVLASADPLLAEAPLDEAEADLPPFLRHRAPRPAPPVVRILGEEAAARPTPLPAARPGAVPSDGPYAVYVLGDPDGTIHYVGYSDNVSRRLAQHLNAAYNPRSRWLQALLDAGEQPRHKIVETVPTRADALAAEQKWIRHYRRAGHPLTNGLLPPEPRTATADPGGPRVAPQAQAAAPPGPAGPPPLPAHRPAARAWLMSLGAAVLLCGLIVWGVGWSHLAPAGPQQGNGDPVGAAGLPLTAVVARPPATPADLSAAPGALAALPTVATGGVAQRAVTVQPGQTFDAVADLLQMPPEALIAQLGRDTVYAGEIVTSGTTAYAVLSQGGGPTPTLDIYNGKGVDAPIAPVIETTVLASTGLCPPGTARAGQPRDGRVVVPFEPGCAPEAAGQVGPQSQPWVPDPPLAQGGGPPASLPATGHADSGIQGAADLLGAVADQAAAALEQTAPEPVSYCADGSVRDLVHRVKAPFVPGCAPLLVGPAAPEGQGSP